VIIMEGILRRSPIDFGLHPAETVNRGGWEVVLDYGTDGPGPWLIDLSHKTKFDLEDRNLAQFKPWSIEVPQNYGQCAFKDGVLINRMNRTQCYIWHLGDGEVETPGERAYTEITDGHCLLAVTGRDALAVMERASYLDLGNPELKPPCLIQGPVLHIPCQVVLFKRDTDSATVLFSFSRGYGQAMVEALLHSGSDLGIKPGGENKLAL
jgi:hypothetical protein